MDFLNLQAKKFLVSKATDTKVGRAQLLKQVGENTAVLLEALTHVVEKYADRATAEAMNKDTVKLAAKVALLWREGVVTPDAAAPLREPMMAAASRLIEALESRPGAIDPTPASEAVRACATTLVPIIKPHMKEKNSAIIAALGSYYSDPAFLAFLFNSALIPVHRDTILSSLHAYMTPFGGAGSRKRTMTCAVSGCELPRLNIRGAEYCQGHQAIKYMYGPPARLDDFLQNGVHAGYFKDHLVGTDHTLAALDALMACRDYAAQASRSLLKSRAPLLMERFFTSADVCGSKYVPLPSDLVASLSETIAEGHANNHTFEPVAEILSAQLQRVYETGFRASRQYAEWAAENLGYDIPPISEGRAAILESAGISIDEVLRPADAEACAHGSAGGGVGAVGGGAGASSGGVGTCSGGAGASSGGASGGAGVR